MELGELVVISINVWINDILSIQLLYFGQFDHLTITRSNCTIELFDVLFKQII